MPKGANPRLVVTSLPASLIGANTANPVDTDARDVQCLVIGREIAYPGTEQAYGRRYGRYAHCRLRADRNPGQSWSSVEQFEQPRLGVRQLAPSLLQPRSFQPSEHAGFTINASKGSPAHDVMLAAQYTPELPDIIFHSI